MNIFSNSIHGAVRLIVMALSLGALVAQAQESTDADALNTIQSIRANNEVGGKVVITVGLKSAPSGQPTTFAINTPRASHSIFPIPRMGWASRRRNSARVTCAAPISSRRAAAHAWSSIYRRC